MKKTLTLFLALTLALCMTLAGAQASPEDLMGKKLKDFSVTTYDGRTFTLSESLKTHDLVVINFWATWCGPCCREFPCLQEAWKLYSNRVDVIAMSVEENDTDEVLKQFTAEYGLDFSVGRDELNMYRNRRVVTVEIGSKNFTEEFTDLFDRLLETVPTAEPSVQL